MAEKKVRAAGYVRVSDESQVETHSLEAQRREIARYCERHGYQLISMYSDEGVSAHSDQIAKRPELVALLEAAKCNEFDVVVVHTLDRWARNVGVQRQALQHLGDAHVGFASVTESIDFTTPAGKLMLTMIGGVSEFFSDQLAVHVSKSKKVRVENGLPAGPLPFGYRAEEPAAVATPLLDEASAVVGVFERKVAGDTNGQIAEWLNEQGFATRTGRMFTGHAIKDMLRTRFYIGVIMYQGREYPGRHAPIVSLDLFEEAQRRRRAPRQPRRQRSGPPSVLHGMLHCGNCGSTLHSDRNHVGYPMYRERHGRRCDTNGRSVVAHRVDEQVGEIIASVELRPEWRDQMAELAVADDGGPSVDALKEQRKRLGRVYMDEAISDVEYRDRLTMLDARIRAKASASQPTLEAAAELFGNLPVLWEEAQPDERRRLVAPFIERVYVDLRSKRIGAFTPSPAFRSLLQGGLERTNRSNAVILTPDEMESPEMLAWWRRGRVELPVQSTPNTNVYGCSHNGLISPAPTRWLLRADPASLSWSFAWRP